MSAASIATAVRKPQGRARVTNGKDILPGVDGRSLVARRFRDLVEELTRELGGSLGAAENCQVRAAASLMVHVEDLMARTARGEFVSAEEMTRAGNSAVRAMAAIRRLRPPAKSRVRRTAHDVLASRMAAE